MDMFCEYLVKRKKGGKEKALVALFILIGILFTASVFWFLLPFIYYVAQPFVSFIFPILAFSWWGILILTKRYNIEFEYTITGTDIDIDKIINRKKRKRVLSTSVRKLEIVAPLLSAKYNDDCKALITVDCSKNDDKKTTYFAVYTKDNQRKCLIFDPSEKMLNIIKYHCREKFFEA